MRFSSWNTDVSNTSSFFLEGSRVFVTCTFVVLWCLWSCASSCLPRLLNVGSCGATAKTSELHRSAHLHARRLTSRPISIQQHSPPLFDCCCIAASRSPNSTFAIAMHEIVTLQFGSQSNHLGTHFWNTQVSSPHDTLNSLHLVCVQF